MLLSSSPKSWHSNALKWLQEFGVAAGLTALLKTRVRDHPPARLPPCDPLQRRRTSTPAPGRLIPFTRHRTRRSTPASTSRSTAGLNHAGVSSARRRAASAPGDAGACVPMRQPLVRRCGLPGDFRWRSAARAGNLSEERGGRIPSPTLRRGAVMIPMRANRPLE